jgi:hypothetical protein
MVCGAMSLFIDMLSYSFSRGTPLPPPNVDACMQDFCIPYRQDKSTFVVKGPATWLENDTIIEQSIEEKTVSASV